MALYNVRLIADAIPWTWNQLFSPFFYTQLCFGQLVAHSKVFMTFLLLWKILCNLIPILIMVLVRNPNLCDVRCAYAQLSFMILVVPMGINFYVNYSTGTYLIWWLWFDRVFELFSRGIWIEIYIGIKLRFIFCSFYRQCCHMELVFWCMGDLKIAELIFILRIWFLDEVFMQLIWKYVLKERIKC